MVNILFEDSTYSLVIYILVNFVAKSSKYAVIQSYYSQANYLMPSSALSLKLQIYYLKVVLTRWLFNILISFVTRIVNMLLLKASTHILNYLMFLSARVVNMLLSRSSTHGLII